MDLERDVVLSKLRQINEYEFEEFIAKLWNLYEWETEVTTGSNDCGVDIIAQKHKPIEQKHLIQVKRWGSGNKVGRPEIQQYSSLLRRENGVDAVVVVTTSSFSLQAEELASELNVKLVDRFDLYDIISEGEAESLVREYIDSKCPVCEITVQDEVHLREHLFAEHGYLECPRCEDIAQDDSTLQEHLSETHGYKRCSYCGDIFQNESARREHLCREHNHSECRYCGDIFQNENSIREHLSEDHAPSELSRIDQKRAKLYRE